MRMFQTAPQESRRNRLGFIIGSIVLFCLLIFSTYWGFRFVEYVGRAKKSQQVIRKISSISVLTERAESGFRGFLYTQDPMMLRRYHLGSVNIQNEIKSLEADLADHPEQMKSLTVLTDSIKKLFSDHDLVIKKSPRDRLFKSGEADKFITGDMKIIREELEKLEAAESRLLMDRNEQSDDFFRAGMLLLFTGTLLSIGLIIWSRRNLSQTAKAAFAQNSLLNSIIENLDEGLVILDAQGNVRFYNATVRTLFGFSFAGLSLNQRAEFFECFDPKSRLVIPADQLPLGRALRGEIVQETELLIHLKAAKREFYVTASARPIFDHEKNVIGAMSLYRDITKRKQIEEEWQKTRELAMDSARLKSQFLTDMSHEIRTPMNGVIGMATLLLNSKLTAEQHSFAQNIKVSAHYLLNMIQSVLDQSQMEKGLLRLQSSPFKIVSCLEHVISILEPTAKNRQIQLFLDCEVEPDLEVVSDSVRLQEVLIDAIEKSIMSTEKGFVSLKVKVLEIFDGNARFHFEIKNSGIHSEPQKEANGKLKISEAHQLKDLLYKEIIRQFDGESETSYQEGFGSTFTLTLDLPLKSSGDKKVIKRHQQIFSDKPVLVAEDQAINQMVIKKYLERFGLESRIVSDGRQAFLEATTGKYCVVLMDCKMQPIDGYEATQLIRTHEKRMSTRIPIIALTADGTPEDRKHCETVGMDDYIVKPIDLEKLENTLQKWIEPVVKEEYLKKLDGYQMEGKPLLHVLAEDYFGTTPTLIDKLETSLEKEDLKQVQYFSHTLKSSSITLGLVELGNLCQKLESATEIESGAKQILSAIKESYRRSEPILRKRIHSRPI